MKNTVTRLLTLLLCLCILFALAGCDSKASNKKNDRKEESSEEDAENQTEDEGDRDIYLEEEIPALGLETAQSLIQWYNTYCNFGVCGPLGTAVDVDTAGDILLEAGYDSRYLDSYTVCEVPCCGTFEQSQSHVKSHIGESLADAEQSWVNAPIEYNGKLYAVVAAMGYGGYYLTGELTQETEKKVTVTAKYDYEETAYTAVFEYLGGNWKLTDIQ